MCASSEEPGEESGVAPDYLGPADIAVVAPRIGIDMETFSQIDWGEVLRNLSIGATAGAYQGSLAKIVIGGAAGAATAIETDVDTEDLFEIKWDLIQVQGLPGVNVPLY